MTTQLAAREAGGKRPNLMKKLTTFAALAGIAAALACTAPAARSQAPPDPY